MRVEAGEIELASDEEQDGAHRREAHITAGLTLGGLKQTVDGLDETVGLADLSPGDDTVEVPTNPTYHVFHRIDLRAHDVGAPLPQHLGDDMDLLAFENLAQLLAIQPGAGGPIACP